jgi:endonuclease-3 related protein
MDFNSLYQALYDHYGPQGWWPLMRFAGTNPTLRGRLTGYHEKRYDIPETVGDRLEIAIGAILTQNTTWPNAEKALMALEKAQCLSITAILNYPTDQLALLIKSSGYYNQKAIKLQNLMRFFCEISLNQLRTMPLAEAREKLLEVKGVGPETADSILLYACQRPIFVVDAYTRRFTTRMGLIPLDKATYEFVQSEFQRQVPASIEIYNEYHALIVQHSVHLCFAKPKCNECFLANRCKKLIVPPKKKKKSSQVSK